MNYKLFLNLVLLFFNLSIVSQINFETKVNKSSLGINERLSVEFTLNEDGDNFNPPSFKNFKVVGGPTQSIKNSWVNGTRSYSKTYTYFLLPIKMGVFKIGQAKIEIDGKLYKTLPVEIKVIAAVKTPNKENDPNYISDGEVYLVSEISKISPYLNEGFSVVHKLYFSSDIGINNWRELSSPRYVDFWSQNINIDNYTVEDGFYNGESYRFVTLKKTVLYPQKEGELIIEPLSLDLTLQLPTNRRDFFGQRIMKSSQKIVTSGGKKIKVKSLPLNNKPKNFSGAVGSFKFFINSSKSKLSVSEALELKLEIKGQGNLKLFQLPEFTLPISLEVYEPEREENISTSIYGMKGSVKDLYTIVPSNPGRYKVPKILFSYFDLDSETYRVVSSDEINIDIDGEEWNTEVATNNDSKIRLKAKVVNFLPFKTKTKLTKIRTNSFFNSSIFWVLLISPLIIVLLILFLIKYFTNRNKFLDSNTSIQAKKLAKKYLAEAMSNLGSKEKFYESLDRALHNYLKSIILFENSNYTKSNIEFELNKRAVDIEIITSLNKLFSNCEMARYTPITDVEMNSDYNKAVKIISKIDKELK